MRRRLIAAKSTLRSLTLALLAGKERPDWNFARIRFVRAGPAPKTVEMRWAIFNGGWHQWFVSPNEEVRFFPWPMLTDRFRRTSGPVDEPGSTRKPLLASPATRPTVAELGSGP